MSGEVGILSVGAGDTKLSFDPNNPQERIRAARIVTDMIRRGYALLVRTEVDGREVYRRAEAFDENTCEYIIADMDPVTAAAADAQEQTDEEAKTPEAAASSAAPTKATRSYRTKRVDAGSTRSVAVARTAGG